VRCQITIKRIINVLDLDVYMEYLSKKLLMVNVTAKSGEVPLFF
jgi:hypothetical protein